MLRTMPGLLRRKIKFNPVGRSSLDRPLRRLQAQRQAPRRAAPCQRQSRQTASAAGYAVPESGAAGSCATGLAASAGLGFLRCRLRGATGRLGLRPACRAPAQRCPFPPPIVCDFGEGSVTAAECRLLTGGKAPRRSPEMSDNGQIQPPLPNPLKKRRLTRLFFCVRNDP